MACIFNNAKFQFLMVRLKVIEKIRGLLSEAVSIPYGTIKRNRNNAAKPYVHSFNSLWYD